MKAIVKKKQSLLSAKHYKAHFDFAIAYKDWTIENQKKIIWSDETKINCLRSDRRKWIWKKAKEDLNNRLIEETFKYSGGFLII